MTDDQLDNDLAEENNPSNEQVDEQPVEDISAAADDETAEDYHVETPEENSEGSDEPDESDEPTAPEAEASVSDDSVETTNDASSDSAEDEESTESHEQPQQDDDASAADEMPIPPASFDLLVMTHASQAMLAMGFMPDPTTGEIVKNLKLAGHHVDMLGILEEKTKGNLTEAEAAMLENSLHQLRMAFVQAKSETA